MMVLRCLVLLVLVNLESKSVQVLLSLGMWCISKQSKPSIEVLAT
ncbi:hypothetical protein GLYMA_16G053067v4 [Glycine max]|nr:hypothetical protein GLYMA_16G053067v4 [Glycine max]KAH1150071.1 hypothetical protein GYH30_044217 [Glycine max]